MKVGEATTRVRIVVYLIKEFGGSVCYSASLLFAVILSIQKAAVLSSFDGRIGPRVEDDFIFATVKIDALEPASHPS